MVIKINKEPFILWHAVDANGYELDVFLHKDRIRVAATRFLNRLLSSYLILRVIFTANLKNYIHPIKFISLKTEPGSHKRLNNRTEKVHQPTRLERKYLLKFKSPKGMQRFLPLMRNARSLRF